MNVVAQAVAMAARAHVNQLDKAGQPYILHPIRVMLEARANGMREEAQAAAVLHDTLEDTDLDPQEIIDMDPEVYRLVILVSHFKPEEGRRETYMEYIARAGSDPESRLIKIFDIRDNYGRLHQLNGEEREFLLKRYHRAIDALKGEL